MLLSRHRPYSFRQATIGATSAVTDYAAQGAYGSGAWNRGPTWSSMERRLRLKFVHGEKEKQTSGWDDISFLSFSFGLGGILRHGSKLLVNNNTQSLFLVQVRRSASSRRLLVGLFKPTTLSIPLSKYALSPLDPLRNTTHLGSQEDVHLLPGPSPLTYVRCYAMYLYPPTQRLPLSPCPGLGDMMLRPWFITTLNHPAINSRRNGASKYMLIWEHQERTPSRLGMANWA